MSASVNRRDFMILPLGAIALSSTVGNATVDAPIYPVRALHGLEPDKFSTNILNINAGSLFNQADSTYLSFPAQTQINLTSSGLWGLDTGSVSNGELYVYALKNLSTGDYGLIATKSKYQSGVVCPSGYQVVRKLPFGVMYNSLWDGIPNFHLTHWPSPLITLTDSESSALWCALASGAATDWTDVDLSPWIPDNARLAYISTQTRYNSAVGSSYIRSYSQQTTGQLVGSVTANCAYQNNTQTLRLSSDRKIQYKNNSTGCRLYIYVLGYSMTEPA